LTTEHESPNFLHPLAAAEPTGEPGVYLCNAFAVAEEMVNEAVFGDNIDANLKVVRMLQSSGLPQEHIMEMFDDCRDGCNHACLRIIEYIADCVVEDTLEGYEGAEEASDAEGSS
jgi:hypothetical protein